MIVTHPVRLNRVGYFFRVTLSFGFRCSSFVSRILPLIELSFLVIFQVFSVAVYLVSITGMQLFIKVSGGGRAEGRSGF